MDIAFEKSDKLLADQLAMVTPQQVKNIADNVEQITGNLRDVTAALREIALWLKSKLTTGA